MIYKDCYKRNLTPITTREDLIEAFEFKNRRVAETQLGDLGYVSTVFLVFAHSYSKEGAPVLFETWVFRGPHSDEMERYCTEEEALAGHERMVKRVMASRSLWRRFTDRLKRKPKTPPTPECDHAWGKWEEQEGVIITKVRGSNRNLLGSQLYRRHCCLCGASEKKWM